MLTARSVAEAHVYMDLQGCERGDRGHTLEARGDELVAVYRTRCGGQERTFEFLIPEPTPAGGHFGGAEPSTLLGPGDWLTHADSLARNVPTLADSMTAVQKADAKTLLDEAAAAVDEVLKFVPEGAEAVPDEAFKSTRDLAMRDRERRRFLRARLVAVAAAYRNLAGNFA